MARRGPGLLVRIDPDHFRASYNLGTMLMDVPGREAEAIKHLENAVRIQPKSTEAQVNLGIALAEVAHRLLEQRRHPVRVRVL